MMLKELIIKVDNKKIYLSPNLTVSIQQTNMPIDHCMFRSHKDIFWKVELLDYNSGTKCWKVKVIDYNTTDINNFNRQKSTREVKQVEFEPFDWLKLAPHLSYYQKDKFLDMLYNHEIGSYNREEPKQRAFPAFTDVSFSKLLSDDNLPQSQTISKVFDPIEIRPKTEVHNVEFAVNFSEVYFMLGYVTFSKNIKEVGEKLDFKIKNDFILAEFENIKYWFAKKLRTKKIIVKASITVEYNIVTDITATSPHIDRIDAALIDSIRYQRTIALTKAPGIPDTDKSLFTAEEIFGEMDKDKVEGNVFNQNEQDILRTLLDNHNIRNRKQLVYLSGSKQAENSTLKFTLHPNFGFLFFIEGKENNHFVWELLNSHATYIWSIDKSEKEIELQYKRIEASINTIREGGRKQYKRAFRQNHIDNDLVFCCIEHDSITSNFVDGFVKWKHKLNEKIT